MFYGFDDNLLGGPVSGDPGVLPRVKAKVNHWYHMAISADFSAKTVTFLVNGRKLGTVAFDDPTYDTLLRASMVVYASPEDNTFTRNAYTARFDDFKIAIGRQDDEDDEDD